MSSPEAKTTNQSETIRKHKEFLFPAVATYYQEPLALVKGEGFHVWDDKGDKYLDAFGGVLTVSVGHANPKVSGFVHARAPYCYRCPFKLTYPECGLACANDIEELIMTTTTGEIAAFMAEPILGVGGFIVPPAGYFERAVEITRKHGGLFIADEVQTAWGRTGEKWFGIENWNVEPDIITSAKGLGNGVPIGITVATPEVADKFPGLTFSTFGGNPVSCAAALAVLKVIEDGDLKKNSAVVGGYFREKLEGLKDKYQVIGDVRSMGLMQAMELVKDRETKEPDPQSVARVFEETKKRRVLVGKGGLYGNVIRTGMMLNSTKDHVDELIGALDSSFGAI